MYRLCRFNTNEMFSERLMNYYGIYGGREKSEGRNEIKLRRDANEFDGWMDTERSGTRLVQIEVDAKICSFIYENIYLFIGVDIDILR